MFSVKKFNEYFALLFSFIMQIYYGRREYDNYFSVMITMQLLNGPFIIYACTE